MARRVRYQVAMSLDGFIAGPKGEYDWIVMDPSIDFSALYKEFDTAVMGRKTYQAAAAEGTSVGAPGLDFVVFSRTIAPESRSGFRIVNDDARKVVAGLKKQPGRDIWLFGGGGLFQSLLEAGLVDSVEVCVIPVLLGEGIPLLPPGSKTKLRLVDQKVLPATGILALSYAVPGSAGPPAKITYIKDSGPPRKNARRVSATARGAVKKKRP
jgi:dihydrofolate reductase